jgi:hypothetical protein
MTFHHDTMVVRTQTPSLNRSEIQTLIGAAGMAPSVLNTQPWAFEIQGAEIDLYADADRALFWSVDPEGRQLVISCGAALFNLRVAAAHIGRDAQVRLRPDHDDPSLLARVSFGQRGRGHTPDAELFGAIRRRHTHRRPFEPRAVPGSVLGELTESVRVEHATIVPIGRSQRRWLFDLIAFSEALLSESPGYGTDLAKWTAGSTYRPDGVPVGSFGTLSTTGAPPMRDFGSGHVFSQQREHYGADPWIAVISTPTDDKIAWLHAGQALERLLLTACVRGLAASFLNQPLDNPTIRRDLTSPALGGYPQMILRLGYASGGIATPRRPTDDLIREHRRR